MPLSMGLFSNLVLAVSASRGQTLAWRVGTWRGSGQEPIAFVFYKSVLCGARPVDGKTQ